MLQGTAEWFEARRGKITASRFQDVLTRGRSKDIEFGDVAMGYAMDIVSEIITGEIKESFSSEDTEWGNTYEPEARRCYEKITFNKVSLAEFYLLQEDKSIGGSPDGLVGKDGIIEIKCPQNNVFLSTLIKQQMPEKHYAQIQGNLWILNRKWCDFISYNPRFKKAGKEIFIQRFTRNDDYIGMLHDRIKLFKKIINETLMQFPNGKNMFI